MKWSRLYRNNLKNREFGKTAPQHAQEQAVRSERLFPNGQGASEDENFEKKTTLPKNGSLGYFGISVFDLDHTLVNGNCSFNFCLYLVSKNVLPVYSLLYAFFYYIRHYLFGLSLEKLHTHVFQLLLRGRSLPQLEEHVEVFVDRYLRKAINASALLRLRLAQHLGHYTLILSNSPSFLVSAVAKCLGVDEWKATRYGVDQEKNLSHIDFILQGKEKADYVKEIACRLHISKEDVTAYSDSYLDLPFLLTAGTPVVVNPDRKLRKYSESHEWTVL